jgi:long-chain acyl-CoA synthetase
MSFNLSQTLRETARRSPQKPCLVLGDRSWSFQDIDGAADLVAANLRALGFEPGAKIGVQLPNVPQFLFAFYGILRAGYVMVPMNPLLTAREIAFQLHDSDCELLMTVDRVAAEALAAAQETGGAAVYVVDTGTGSRPQGTYDFNELLVSRSPIDMAGTDAGDTAVIIYTSGTTGRPKGAELSHFAIYMSGSTAMERIKFDSHDTALALLPFFHIYGLTSVLNVAIQMGFTMVLLPRFDPAAALDLIENHRVAHFSAVPTMLIAMLEVGAQGRHLTSLKLVVSGGSALPAETLRRFEKEFPNATVLEGYGLSESTSSVSVNVSREERRPLSIGKPLWGSECRIVDANDCPLPPGSEHVGEMLYRGPTIMKGYYRNPEATAAALKDGWLRTGDMGYADEDGFVYVVDRKKELIIRGGYNVYPREVEEVIATHPAVSEVAVVGKPDHKYGQEIVAVISLRAGTSVTSEDIISYAKGSLSAYKYPREVRILEALPKTATGKILKRKIAESVSTLSPQA